MTPTKKHFIIQFKLTLIYKGNDLYNSVKFGEGYCIETACDLLTTFALLKSLINDAHL